jgi:hypothetical protein
MSKIHIRLSNVRSCAILAFHYVLNTELKFVKGRFLSLTSSIMKDTLKFVLKMLVCIHKCFLKYVNFVNFFSFSSVTVVFVYSLPSRHNFCIFFFVIPCNE